MCWDNTTTVKHSLVKHAAFVVKAIPLYIVASDLLRRRLHAVLRATANFGVSTTNPMYTDNLSFYLQIYIYKKYLFWLRKWFSQFYEPKVTFLVILK